MSSLPACCHPGQNQARSRTLWRRVGAVAGRILLSPPLRVYVSVARCLEPAVPFGQANGVVEQRAAADQPLLLWVADGLRWGRQGRGAGRNKA